MSAHSFLCRYSTVTAC